MKSRGFSLVELVGVLAVVVSLGTVLGPSVGQIRGQMRGASSEGNLHMIGQGAGMYGLDHNDRIFTFTWEPGVEYLNVRNGKMISADNDLDTGALQARDILFRNTGRLDGISRIVVSQGRLVHRRFSHLVLADYLGVGVESSMWSDPADQQLLGWQGDPLAYLNRPEMIPYGAGYPTVDGYDMSVGWDDLGVRMMWAFGSSYHLVPHAYLDDERITYRPNANTPHLFFPENPNEEDKLSERTFLEVSKPSAKVFMYEEFDRELERDTYFAYDHARPAKLMFDGSINTMPSGRSRGAIDPWRWSAHVHGELGFKTIFEDQWEQAYVPLDLFPEPLSGLGEGVGLNMRYQWTAGGLQGRDYNPLLSESP